MGKSYFQFKQFTIHQDKCAMKVGTDGVLVGAWADISDAETILDIGTGTGLIAMMCSQRNPSAKITAIEIDKDSADQAKQNVLDSDFNDRIQVYNTSLQEYSTSDTFDAIVCNPPFFSSGTPSPTYQRYLARQAASLPLRNLLEHCMRLLNPNGKLHLVFPLDREQEFDFLCEEYELCTTKRTIVYPSSSKPAKRVLLECSRICSPKIEDELIIEKDERFDYTDQFISLTRDFYPKME